MNVVARDVTRQVADFHLGPISLELEPGLVYALVGPNGSGKTTLFRLLMGLLHADEGNIERFGEPVLVDDQRQTARIGYLPELLSGHDTWLISDLIELYRRTYLTFDLSMLDAPLEEIDRTRPFSKLSKGQQRRAMLALVLAAQPELLLLDEPTDGIDPFARKDVQAALSQFMEPGDRTTLIATHSLEDVRSLADIVIVLDRGRQVGTWSKDELIEGWRRLWLSRDPTHTLPGEVERNTNGGIAIVTNDALAARLELERQGIEVTAHQPVDLVEVLRLLIDQRNDKFP